MGNTVADKFGNYLVANKLITPEVSAELQAQEKKTKNFEELLINRGVLDVAKLLRAKSEAYNLPGADLSEISLDPAIVGILPREVAKNYQMVIFALDGKNIKVGMVNPDDFRAHNALEFLASQKGLHAEYFVILMSDFNRIIEQYGGFKKEIGSAIKFAQEKFEKKGGLISIDEEEAGDWDKVVKTAPVAKIVSVIIKHAIDGGASDIHIEPGKEESRVRYRVDGILHTTLILPAYLHSAVISRIKVLANLKLDETRIPQDGRIRIQFENNDIDLRVSVLPMLNDEKVVIRVLDNSAGIQNLSELGFAPYHTEIIEKNIKKPFGVFLLTGPTGSGKTTTLYSILNMLNSEEFNITTLEDPIEYYVTGVNQSQVNPDIGYSFAQGLRSILRQDPNIIMVGEIRDNETAELVVHAGLTGHLVFSTLHTNNAWGAVPRLIDMEAQPFLLSSTLILVMAQRLVRKICTNCKEEIALPPNLVQKINTQIDLIPDKYLADSEKNKIKFYRGKGCSACSNSGYSGRSVISEVLEISTDIRDLISKEDFHSSGINKVLEKNDYVNMLQDGILKAISGITTIEEVLRAVEST